MELGSTDVEAKKFDVVKRGYDKEQVSTFLDKVSRSMSRTDERRKLAEVRAEQLEREFRDLKARADATIQETVAARVRLLDAASGDTPPASAGPTGAGLVSQATLEAQQIIEQANTRSASLQAEAEAVIEGALATSAKINQERADVLGSTEAERATLIAAAAEQAAAIKDEASQAREHARAEADGQAARIRHQAQVDADRLMTAARMEARSITADAEQQRDDLFPAIDKPQHGVVDAGQHAETPAPTGDVEPTREPTHPVDDVPDIAIDLREGSDRDEPIPTTRSARTSRYKSQSANLPHLGDDASSVIGSLSNLRTKD